MTKRFPGANRREQARAYVYAVTAAMFEAQYATAPENTEGWMFGGINDERERSYVLDEIMTLQREMLERAERLRL